MWQRYIDGQYRRPTGLVGRWIGRKMAEQHQPENNWTVKVLNIQPTDHVLEVGFGPGFAVQQAAKAAQFVAGVDFSQAMLSAASARNAAAIRAGSVRLQYGDSSRLPFNDESFDKAFSIHSIYFWTQPAAALREIWRVLKPNGTAVFTVLPKERWNEGNPDAAVGTPECKPYTGAELQKMLTEAGFSSTHVEADDEHPQHRSNYSVVARK